MSEQQFDAAGLVKAITDHFVERWASNPAMATDFEENAGILFNFNHIASNLLKDEPGLDMPGAPQPIPVDEQLTMSIVHMFSEGVFFAINRCTEIGITGEAKKTILQDMALEVYNQAKQVIACTYGQESTPNFQFSAEQQVMMMTQSAEGHLMFFMAEYEKRFGPIELYPRALFPPPPEQEQAAPEPQQAAPAPAPAPVPIAPVPVAPLPQPVLRGEKEKYAALAMLIGALSPRQRNRILASVSGEGKEIIEYYSDRQKIRSELNLKRVHTFLIEFRDQLLENRENMAKVASPHQRQLKLLVESMPEEKLLSLIQEERSTVRRYLEAMTPRRAPTSWQGMNQFDTFQQPQAKLPPRIEEILHDYLVRRVS